MKRLATLAILYCLAGQIIFAQDFRFKYITGDKYRVLSTVDEDIYINRRFVASTKILNRIAFSVVATEGTSGTYDAVFQTSEEMSEQGGKGFLWSREYHSKFDRDERGHFSIAPEYWMPVVRNVPIFPQKALRVGESWSAKGEEAHDFRDHFGIPEPYRIPFLANYTYKGKAEIQGQQLDLFLVSYTIFHEGEKPQNHRGIWPHRIMGSSNQEVYWDDRAGQPVFYREDFRFIIDISDGNSVEYRGKAEAKFVEAQLMDREKIAWEINEDLKRSGIDDMTARVSEEGVSINLENLQFKANTNELLPNQNKKLEQIASILNKYPDRDLLIKGHTASTNSPRLEMELSVLRASSIADYLVNQGLRSRERIVVRGYGASLPVAPNDSEANMAKNRRVEIVILEN